MKYLSKILFVLLLTLTASIDLYSDYQPLVNNYDVLFQNEYQRGWKTGYRVGYKESHYNLTPAYIPYPPSEYGTYEEGFKDGFHEGYYDL